MKPILLVTFGACFCSVFGCAQTAETSAASLSRRQSGPLFCSQPMWDLGEVLVKGKAIDFEHVFHIENRSSKAVTLRDVRSDCGCVVTKGYDLQVDPGKSTDIKVTISVFGPPGGFQKTIAVIDNTSNAAYQLSIVGSRAVSGLLSSTPGRLNFGSLRRGSSKTKEIVISRCDGSTVNFRSLSSKNDNVVLDGSPVCLKRHDEILRKEYECIQLPVKLTLGSERFGELTSKLTIHTDSTDESTANLEVEFEATVVEDPSPWVRSIYVSRLEAGQRIERAIVDVANSDQTPRIVSGSYSGDDSINVELVEGTQEIDDTATPRISITRRAGRAAGSLARGRFTMKSADSENDSAVITISVFLPD